MLTPRGQAKILDFGLAKGLDDGWDTDGLGGELTQIGRSARDARVYVARADPRRTRRSPNGHLFVRHRPLRDGDGSKAIHGEEPRRPAPRYLQHQPARNPFARTERAEVPREDRRTCDGKAHVESIPVDERPARRSQGSRARTERWRGGARRHFDAVRARRPPGSLEAVPGSRLESG